MEKEEFTNKRCNISLGDIVNLKSGGPFMTINHWEHGFYSCVWFVGETVNYGQFHADALYKIKIQ